MFKRAKIKAEEFLVSDGKNEIFLGDFQKLCQWVNRAFHEALR